MQIDDPCGGRIRLMLLRSQMSSLKRLGTVGKMFVPQQFKPSVDKEDINMAKGENIFKRKDGRWEARYIKGYYHQLTRTHTVLTGRKTPMLLQSPCQYTKYCLRAFHCLNAFLLRQNCCAPDSDGFLCDFWFLSRRRADARQGEKDKKHRKDTLSGVCALVN